MAFLLGISHELYGFFPKDFMGVYWDNPHGNPCFADSGGVIDMGMSRFDITSGYVKHSY